MWLQCFGKCWWFPEKWRFLPWKLPPPFQMQRDIKAWVETLIRTAQNHVWRIMWDNQDEKELRNIGLIRLELQSDHLAKQSTESQKDWWMWSPQEWWNRKSPTNISSCAGLWEVSFRNPELAGILPHSVRKWCNVCYVNVNVGYLYAHKFLCCWFGPIIQGQVFVQPSWIQTNSWSCLVSICEKSLYFILFYSEKKHQLYFMQSLH